MSSTPRLSLVQPEPGQSRYAALAAATRRMAEGLARQGIGPGDRVAIWLPNRPEFLVLLFALARLGATAILLNTRWRAEELARVLDRARPTAIAADWSFAAADGPALLADERVKTAYLGI